MDGSNLTLDGWKGEKKWGSLLSSPIFRSDRHAILVIRRILLPDVAVQIPVNLFRGIIGIPGRERIVGPVQARTFFFLQHLHAVVIPGISARLDSRTRVGQGWTWAAEPYRKYGSLYSRAP